MSLRWRIALALAAIAAVVGALAATGAYLTTADQLERAIDGTLTAATREAQAPRPGRPGRGDRDPDGTFGCPVAGSTQALSAAELLGADGSAQACVDGAVTLPVDDADRALATGRGAPRFRTVNVDGHDLRVLTSPIPGGGAVQVARTLEEMDEVLSRLQLRLAALAVAAALAAGAVGWFVARRIVRPVVRLRDAARSIATTQDLGTPIPSEGVGEVGSLATSFTTMVQALATSRQQQQRLITDASHELRTPLTSLRTNLELLERTDLPAADRREVLAALHVDAAELTNLVSELVELATDPGAEDEAPEAVELDTLVADVVRRAGRRSGRAITLAVEGGPVDVVARPQMVERAVSNLVDNAVKYSPAGAPVEVVVRGGQVEVRDHGAGIAPVDQPFVFERFYRATAARTEPGSGLGLAIVKQIVDRHGGRVWAVNDPGGGARVGFELPTATTAVLA